MYGSFKSDLTDPVNLHRYQIYVFGYGSVNRVLVYKDETYLDVSWTYLDLETVSTFVYTQPMEIRFEITEIKQ